MKQGVGGGVRGSGGGERRSHYSFTLQMFEILHIQQILIIFRPYSKSGLACMTFKILFKSEISVSLYSDST